LLSEASCRAARQFRASTQDQQDSRIQSLDIKEARNAGCRAHILCVKHPAEAGYLVLGMRSPSPMKAHRARGHAMLGGADLISSQDTSRIKRSTRLWDMEKIRLVPGLASSQSRAPSPFSGLAWIIGLPAELPWQRTRTSISPHFLLQRVQSLRQR
jgi:hypothetical protein